MNNHFERIVCINLYERPDRFDRMQKRFNRYGIKAEFYRSFINGFNSQFTKANLGQYITPRTCNYIGATIAHYQVIKKAQYDNVESIAIFEDDAAFTVNFADKLNEYMSLVPDNWDFIYLGGVPLKKLNMINEKVFKAELTNGAFAYCIRRKLYQTVIDNLDKRFKVIDRIYEDLQNSRNIYGFAPPLCITEDGFSNCVNDYREYFKDSYAYENILKDNYE